MGLRYSNTVALQTIFSGIVVNSSTASDFFLQASPIPWGVGVLKFPFYFMRAFESGLRSHKLNAKQRKKLLKCIRLQLTWTLAKTLALNITNLRHLKFPCTNLYTWWWLFHRHRYFLNIQTIFKVIEMTIKQTTNDLFYFIVADLI